MAGPLAGVKVLDLTSVFMGPLATMAMADIGADIIKVESLEGDMMRYIGPNRHRDMSALYLGLNSNKRSIALDLKHPEGRAALLKLVQTADVLLYNIRPASMARLDLGVRRGACRQPEDHLLRLLRFRRGGAVRRQARL